MKTTTLAALAATMAMTAPAMAQSNGQTAPTQIQNNDYDVQMLPNGGKVTKISGTTLVFDKAGTVTCMKTTDQNGQVQIREMAGTKCPAFVTAPSLQMVSR